MTPTAKMPDWLEPMAATLTQDRFSGRDWLFERKFDGIRLLAYKSGADVRLYSRNRLPQDLPALAEAIAHLPVDEVILDGEVTWDGRSGYHVFDILWLNGRPVTGLPLEDRRALLQDLPFERPMRRVELGDDQEPWERARREGWEGVIAKRRGSPYEHRRSKHWLKMKCEASQEFVVGGFTDPQGARVGLGALLVGYEAMAPVILPHLGGRPITMERYPAGIGQKGFWQKDVSKGFPEWLQRVTVPKKDGVVRHPVVTDTRSLLWITNQNTITQHVWTSRIPDLNYPDVCVFDLDPSKEDAAEVRAAAIGLRDLLEELTLPSWIKTTGSKGFHIVVPIDGKTHIGVVARFATAVGTLLVSHAPDRLTQQFSKADRSGRIYVDTGRNGYSATFAAAYTVRAKRGAPVSAPCTWEEIERGEVNPGTFTLRNMPDRIAKVGDVWTDMRRRGRSLKRPMETLRRLIQR